MRFIGHLLTEANPRVIDGGLVGADIYWAQLVFGNILVLGGNCNLPIAGNTNIDQGIFLAAYDVSSGTPVMTSHVSMSMRAVLGDYPNFNMQQAIKIDASRGCLSWFSKSHLMFMAFSVTSGGQLALGAPVDLGSTGVGTGFVRVSNTADWAALPNNDNTFPNNLQLDSGGFHNAALASYGDGRMAFSCPGSYGSNSNIYVYAGTRFTVTGLTITPGNWYVLSDSIPIGSPNTGLYETRFDAATGAVVRNGIYEPVFQTRALLSGGNNNYGVHAHINFDLLDAGGSFAAAASYRLVSADGTDWNSDPTSMSVWDPTVVLTSDGRVLREMRRQGGSWLYEVADASTDMLLTGVFPFVPGSLVGGFAFTNDPTILVAADGVFAASDPNTPPVTGYILSIPATGQTLAAYNDQVGSGNPVPVGVVDTTDVPINVTPPAGMYFDTMSAVVSGAQVAVIIGFQTSSAPYHYYQDIQVFQRELAPTGWILGRIETH